MSDPNDQRIVDWIPPERPEWVARIIEEGSYMDISGIVPLDEASLISTAKANTGLDDFGEDSWYEPFQVLIRSLEEESDLHLLGRLRVRSEILHFLEARLRIEEAYKQHPEIDDEQIQEPVLILGQGRSGTSALLNLLSSHPENGVIKSWEAMFPCPPPEKETYLTDPRIEKSDKLWTQWNRANPGLLAIHQFTADIPVECVYLFGINFYPGWANAFAPVPSYNEYMFSRSMIPAFNYHTRVLKLLQWKNPRHRWVLKAPQYVDWLDQIVVVYPDAKFVWPHRDPSKTLGSGVAAIGNTMWGRSNDPLRGAPFEWLTQPEPAAARLNQAIDWLEGGLLNEGQLCNVQYQDFVKDPVGTVKNIYTTLNIPLTDEGLAAVQKYVDEHPRTNRPAHRYAEASEEQMAYERKTFGRYLDYFNVVLET